METSLREVPMLALFGEIRRRCQATGRRRLIAVGELTIDVGTRVATWRGREVQLSARDFEVLAVLAGAHPRRLRVRQIASLAWGTDTEDSARKIVTYIWRLKGKLPGLLDQAYSGRCLLNGLAAGGRPEAVKVG